MKNILPLVLLILLLTSQCGGKNIKNNNGIQLGSKQEQAKAEQMLQWISAINNSSPSTLTANVYLNGMIERKTYKSTGYTRFNKSTSRMIISFVDFVFKSPITTLAKDGTVIKFYFPANKKMYIDNYDMLDLYNYTGLNIDFRFLYKLATGQIPMISNFSVKKIKGDFLILENNNFFETISFKGTIPDKILLITKSTKERFEFYLSSQSTKNKSMYFKRVKVISKKSQMVFDFYFNDVIINGPVTVDANFHVPSDVKTTVVN